MNYKQAIRNVIDNTDTAWGRRFTFAIQFLIVVSLISFSVGTLPDVTTTSKRFLVIIELLTIGVFTIEYLLRLIIAERKLKFMFSFYGLVDLVSILPFYIATGLDLRAIRMLRLLRLIRLLKLFKYNKAINRLQRAITIAKEELILFGFIASIVLYLSAVGIYYCEHAAQPELFKSVFHCLWWALITLTTVGYGDMYPITVGGKLFTFVMLTMGLGIVAIPTGLIASALSKAREEDV